MAEVELENLCKTYPNGTEAVRGVSVNIKDGEFLALVGPSGCGKTTLLRMVAGLETIDSGILRIGGKEANDLEPKDRDVSMVFQNYALYPHMTAFDNMAFGLRARGTDREKIRERVREVAAKLGISDYLERKPGVLSGGQRQRVALGRAIARRPVLFLMDEPLSNLDARLRVEMRRELKLLRGELNTTTLYVTHDQVEAMTLGDRVCVMEKGEVRQLGTPKEVYEQPADTFVAGFLGSPPMNFLEGEPETGQGDIFFAIAESRIPLEKHPEITNASRFLLGVRPEDLSLNEEPKESLQGKVELIEEVGEARLIHVRVGKQLIVAKSTERKPIEEGHSVSLRANPERCLLFDKDSGKNLSMQG